MASARTFKDSFASWRCLVPSSCWYEWTGAKGAKVQWRFDPREADWLCFGGIWDRCVTQDAGEVLSFSIITQPAGAPLNGYHDRAPEVIPRESWGAWMDPTSDVQHLLGGRKRRRLSRAASALWFRQQQPTSVVETLIVYFKQNALCRGED